jgi:hypothetical protein
MMATNMPQRLDGRCCGRAHRPHLQVGYRRRRRCTYEGYLAKVRHELTPDEVDKLATITYATGATIKRPVNEALINAIRDGRETIGGRTSVKAKHLKDLGPPEDVEYIERERHATALHEACHAVVAYRVRHHLIIDIATIEKGGNYLGMVSSIPPEDLFTRWRSEYESRRHGEPRVAGGREDVLRRRRLVRRVVRPRGRHADRHFMEATGAWARR